MEERTRWLAFDDVDAAVETYGTYEPDLKAVGVELVDWMDFDGEARRMKLDHAMKRKR